jgi:glutamine---fructose-6-phosphate transaminase (isomerizing)
VKKMDKQITEFKWEEEVEEKNFDHYMRKEINEIPEVSQRLLLSLENEQKENTNKITEMIKNSKRVVFLASGSSYYAALLGAQLLARAGIDARAIISSEFRSFTIIDENTLAIAVSQSGETMDVIEALRGIKAKGAKIASIVNVPYSTIQRMSSTHINIEAGQEICVAATKTFVNQVITMAYLASKLGYVSDIQNISGFVKDVINQEEKIKEIAKTFEEEKNVFILGKGISYPIAAEIALKLKEISYIHAEGMMGGELKHGTMALIEEGTPVICLAPKNRKSILTNADEVKLRGARVVYFGQDDVELASGDDVMFAISAVVAGQLLTYHIAKGKGLPIDKPRNIAKSVTVR